MMGKSNSDAAPTTEMVFCNTSTPHNSARSPWAELDEECQALEKNPLAGMGHTSDWFGGSVTLRAVYDSKTKKLVLKMPTLDTSSALKRRFGSWNFLRVKTEDNSKETLEFFLRPVVILGMVFRALHASQDQGSSHVTMVCVDEAYTAGKIKKTLVRKGVAYQLWDFINFLNDLEVNKRQFIGKYAARFALYLSASTPGPLLEQDAIHEQEDHYSEPNENGERSNMTDGCGISTWSLHEQFLKRSKVQATAIQFRLRGGKGMTLCVHDKEWLGKTDSKEPLEDEPPSPELWLRDSQIKIKFPSGRLLDPLHLTLAVLNYSQMRVSVQLSPEVIINLESNKVPATYFESLARACVRQIVANFTTIDTDLGLFRIWDAVNNAEGITTMRDIRATGIMQRKWNQKDDEENDGGMYPPDPSSGYPSSLGEVVMELLDSGFSPMDCVFLREKIRLVAKAQLNRKKVDYHFEVEKSCAAYVVSDPFGVLGPNEIQIKASGPKFLRDTGYYAHEIIGDVVMTRNPCKIPTDARKFKATTHPKLATMTDVIVCSIQGKIRLLDMLGGGDYDGDRAIVFWDHNIVNSFQDADLKYMTPPPGFEDMFEKDTTSVADFLASVESLSTELKTVELQKHLVGELESISNVGRISVQHDHCIYVTGSYAHPDSVMVGHM
ncbi:RNA-dependent RNA polymerase [Mucidula mucida]|nr:RNA-dependent RNA polymerase [Mucidula mucida]